MHAVVVLEETRPHDMYGSVKEAEVRQQYITYQRTNGHPNLTVDECGSSCLSLIHGWLQALVDVFMIQVMLITL